MSIHLLIKVSFEENKFRVLLEVQMIFRLIRLKKQIYPYKKKKNKKKKKYRVFDLLKDELSNMLSVVKKIKIIELYSKIEFGHTNFYTTAYVDAFTNAIYANVANIVKCKKLYLSIVPNFTQKKIEGEIKVHIKFRLIKLFNFIPILFRILRNKKYIKEDDLDDSNKFNTEHYGDNVGNN